MIETLFEAKRFYDEARRVLDGLKKDEVMTSAINVPENSLRGFLQNGRGPPGLEHGNKTRASPINVPEHLLRELLRMAEE